MQKIVEGKPWPTGRSKLVRAAMRPIAQSPSENYCQADWYLTDMDPNDADHWPSFKGDESVWEIAGIPFLRMSRQAGLVAVREIVMAELRGAHPNTVDGVVTKSLGGRVWACVLPEGVQPALIGIEERNFEVTGARIGRYTLQFMPVRIDTVNSNIIVPQITEGDVQPLGPRFFVPRLLVPYQSVPVV